MVGQQRLAKLHYGFIDLDHGDLLDAAMLADLAQDAAIAAANDQHAPGQAMREDRHVSEHLVIDEFVGLGGLDDPIEGHHPPHAGVLEDDQALMFGACFVEHPVDAKALAVAVV